MVRRVFLSVLSEWTGGLLQVVIVKLQVIALSFLILLSDGWSSDLSVIDQISVIDDVLLTLLC